MDYLIPRNAHFYATARRLMVNPDTINGRADVLDALHAEALVIDAEITTLRAELKGTAPGVRWADGVPCDHAPKRCDCEWCNPRTIEQLIAEALDEARRTQVLAWLRGRGVGQTPTPGTVRRGVELDHADAVAENKARDAHDPLCTERCCIPPVPAVAAANARQPRSRPAAVLAPQLNRRDSYARLGLDRDAIWNADVPR